MAEIASDQGIEGWISSLSGLAMVGWKVGGRQYLLPIIAPLSLVLGLFTINFLV
jgi:hypothetical protein